jgi:hypothetical protein
VKEATFCNLHAVIATETMKGYKKKKTSFFQPGNIPHNKGVRYLTDGTLPISRAASVPVTRRMEADMFSLIAVTNPTNGLLQSAQVPDCHAKLGSAKLLQAQHRPNQNWT